MKRQDAEGERGVMSPQVLKIGSLNMCRYSMLEGTREVIGRMCVEKKVLALSEPKLKGKGNCKFGCVSGWMSGVTRGRAKEGVALMVSLALRLCVVEWKDLSSRLMWLMCKV